MQHLWDSALATLRSQLSEENFRTWLEPVQLERLDARSMVLRVPNRFYADWLSLHYIGLILDSLRRDAEGLRAAGLDVRGQWEVEWIVDEALQKKMDAQARSGDARAKDAAARDAAAKEPSAAREEPSRTAEPAATRSAPPPPTESPADSGLNPKYRFDNFIVGPSNQLAHAASMAAASSPGTRYNPLFIYGGVGLGKTHLVNAIGHRIRQDKPDARVLFLSAERFTNEFIWALQHKRIDEFRGRYRGSCDVLVIDDIQFLAGREQTQEEFFHTFNALYHADKQIVVTSDVYPQHIPEMQERLISRFQWGLVADIQAPELDTRIAILRKKAEQEDIALPDDVALLMAQVVQSNVRELEGTLLRLAVYADSMRRSLDMDVARTALGAQLPKDRAVRQTTVEDVQRATCEYFQIGLKELMSDRRHRNVSQPRMIAMYICRERLELSYPMIGARFGNKDHTTVMNAHRKIKGLSESDERVQRAIEVIERKIGLV